MREYTIEIGVKGGDIFSTVSRITADSVEYVTAVFSFDDSWAELVKTAIFRVGEKVYHTPIANDRCKIPAPALTEGLLYISAFGVNENTRATTSELPVSVVGSGYSIIEPEGDYIDPYNYFILKATELSAAANESADIATAAAETAKENADKIATAADASVDAAERAEQAADTTVSGIMKAVETHNLSADSHDDIRRLALDAKVIAEGRARAISFDSEDDLFEWMAGRFERSDGRTPDDLNIGDTIYIVEEDVPDYWWDGNLLQIFESEKPDLTGFCTTEQLTSRLGNTSFEIMGRNAYDMAYIAGTLESGRIYFVYEEEQP